MSTLVARKNYLLLDPTPSQAGGQGLNTNFSQVGDDVEALTAAVAAKVGATRTLATTSPLTGGGDLSANRTIAIPVASTSANGYLSSTDYTRFSVIADNGVLVTRRIDTSSPLTGGGDLTADRTISIPQAAHGVDGFLKAIDFDTFTAKVAASRQISTTAPLSGGGNLSADRTLSMPSATASVDGYLAHADFATFAGKSSGTVAGTIGNLLKIGAGNADADSGIAATNVAQLTGATFTGDVTIGTFSNSHNLLVNGYVGIWGDNNAKIFQTDGYDGLKLISGDGVVNLNMGGGSFSGVAGITGDAIVGLVFQPGGSTGYTFNGGPFRLNTGAGNGGGPLYLDGATVNDGNVINAITFVGALSGTASGNVIVVTLATPSVLFTTPITFANTAGAGGATAGGTLSFATQTANVVLAGPSSGAAATPTMRALVAADVGTGTGNSAMYLRGDMSWIPLPANAIYSALNFGGF